MVWTRGVRQDSVGQDKTARRSLPIRVAGVVIGVIVLGLALWSRAPQVAAFLAAAGLRRASVAADIPHPRVRAEDWGSLPSLPSEPSSQLNSAALVCYHPEYQAYNPAKVDKALRKAAELGAGWLRTDVRWSELMPDGQHVNAQALDWYQRFLPRCKAHGFRNLLVVSWPSDVVLKYPVDQRLEAWSTFVETVVRELGEFCDGYQLMNEPNNPVFGFFPDADTPGAIAGAAATIKSHYPKAYVLVNICMEIWGWRPYLTDLLFRSGRAIDIIGLDHYPGTWTIGPPERWADLFEIYDLINSSSPSSIWFDRKLAILETGFSTNAWLRGESAQEAYFSELEHVARRLRAVKDAPLIGIYELSDWDSSALLDPEAHFGLLKTDLAPKSAFSKAHELLSSLQ